MNSADTFLSDLFAAVVRSERTMLLGDCFDLLPAFPPASVDLVLTDPPYNVTRCEWDAPIDLNEFWHAVGRVAKPSAAIIVFACTPFDKTLAASNLAWLRHDLIWHKTEPTGHFNARRAPLRAHENILVFGKQPVAYFPVKSTGHVRKTATRRPRSGGVYDADASGSVYDSTERYPTSVLTYSTDKQRSRLHPTQKPVALLRRLVEMYSRPGDVVLDCFAGSGSTAVAARAEGRRFVGIEKDTHFFNVALDRIEASQ